MSSPSTSRTEITPQILLRAYACGMFPMAESADDPSLYWVEPERRGIFPLDRIHISARLARTCRADRFAVTANRAFTDVIAACAALRGSSNETWINGRIRDLYSQLHALGHAHSVECWDTQGALVGGLYGVSLGRAFFGESMFHRARDASKVALVHLAAMLIEGGFILLDTQFVTEHLTTLGAIEISRTRYRELLDEALIGDGAFPLRRDGRIYTGAQALAIVATHAA